MMTLAASEWNDFHRASLNSGVLIERVIKSFYRRVLPTDGIAIDVGAHVGYHTLGLAEKLIEGLVVGCEANPKTYLALLKALSRHSGGGKTLTINSAIQEDPSRQTVTFHVSEDHPGRSGIQRSWRNIDYSERTVTARTIDCISASLELPRVDFIKCDVEGTEFEVFKGAQHVLREYSPIIVAEHSMKPTNKSQGAEWVKFFRELDYVPLFPNGAYVTEDNFNDYWYVFIFPSERVDALSELLAATMASWRAL